MNRQAPRTPIALAAAALLAAALLRPSPEAALAKGGAPKGPPKTGVWRLAGAPLPAGLAYVQMAVPKDYDPSKWYPLMFFLASEPKNVDPFVQAWADAMADREWIVAGPAGTDFWDNATSVDPLRRALQEVQDRYRVDDRRIVLAGHSAGANMLWCLATAEPKPWAALLAMNGEVPQQAQGGLKALAGKRAYLFTGDKDKYYSPEMLDKDKKFLDFAKVKIEVEIRKEWASDFPTNAVGGILAWLDSVWPPGAYREKAEAVEKALAAKDLAAAFAALKEMQADLKKNPYPAFEARAAAHAKSVLDLGRSLLEDAKALVPVDPLVALAKMEAAVKAVKGMAPVDKEAAAALAALKKDPVVVAALKRQEAEKTAASYMERGMAAEAKADGAKALEWYRKVVALGETSQKPEAEKRIAEIEKTIGGG